MKTLKKILFIIGTRPEIIKTAPVIMAFKKDRRYRVKVCFTGQHQAMAMQMINEFKIKIDYDLNLMQPGQSLEDIASVSMLKLPKVFSDFQPDIVVTQGDTTTAFCAALVAFYMRIKVAHIEAGLRTYDKSKPYPEELNRTMISRIADLHFAPTPQAKANLIKEGIPRNSIVVTGNTVVDALFYIIKKKKVFVARTLRHLPLDKKIILVTMHRRENFGAPLRSICKALKIIAKNNPDVVTIYPVHLNPNVLKPVRSILRGIKNILLVRPLGYADFIRLMNRSYFILTDSGGIQEEAPSLGKPVLILREKTERPEVVRAGCAKIVGTNNARIVRYAQLLLNSRIFYQRMSQKKNPVGDGRAAKRIKDKFDRLR
jgi:UDP-N-acetylglucosamine 2-epimerase (non-hydrolysing)